MSDDIVSIPAGDAAPALVSCGFFTSNYRPLAQRLSGELGPQNPHHFFSMDKGQASWFDIVGWKPRVIQRALDLYPRSAIAFLDMDSQVRGSLAPLADINADVSARAKTRISSLPWRSRRKCILVVSARVMVFKPNDRVRKFLADWHDAMADSSYRKKDGAELALGMVLMSSPGLTFTPIDPVFAGLEIGTAPANAVLTHISESEKTGRS